MRYPVFRTRHVGPSTPGAVVESHQLQFSKNPGPSGPEEIAESHSDFARRKFLPGSRGNPRKWGPGPTPPVRGRWPEGPEGVGWATMSTKCSSGAVPGAFWVISPVLPAKPSAAGSPGRGGARKRSQFSPLGGNGDKRTLRRRAAVGKVTRRPQAAKSPAYNERSPNPVPSSVTASPCRLSLSPLSLRDISP